MIEDSLSVPATFATLQVYFALSSTSPPLINKESPLTETFSSSLSRTPSFSHVTSGVGTPLTGHLMVMEVFEAAVTLSPMFIVTELLPPMGISRPVSGTSIFGLVGSVCIKKF